MVGAALVEVFAAAIRHKHLPGIRDLGRHGGGRRFCLGGLGRWIAFRVLRHGCHIAKQSERAEKAEGFASHWPVSPEKNVATLCTKSARRKSSFIKIYRSNTLRMFSPFLTPTERSSPPLCSIAISTSRSFAKRANFSPHSISKMLFAVIRSS